ncbi:glycosyltransferase family protein [Winogradskyella aurantia]|uniref:Glycosyltransferase subfamily 4-like N-terminal domain-containing protein n=1 Tax=Winogradskyella aurantia TaxID=1915063 RepID=A0A265UV94_9FLAO|nr:hypothetical protein [Winogradskyella aurantia]OZV69241.1 hypothetical protein CA834_07230 [Winogradskyella aurantia]
MHKKGIYISSIIPDTSCGAHIAIHRHFVQRNDFDIAVVSYQANTSETSVKFVIPMSKIRKKAQNSRFSKLIWNFHYLWSWFYLPKSVLEYAKKFEPDFVFTVPDNIHSGFALQLSKQLNIPLVVDFQDLFPYSQFIKPYMEPYGWVREFLMKKFRLLNHTADLAFYTSEGMQNFFGGHKNGHVLYPIGDANISNITSEIVNNRFTIAYAGNCYGAYGRMLLQFAKLIKNHDELHLKIFPVGKGWSDEDIQEMKEAGIYQSFMPFEALKKELAAADAFLTVMSFEELEKPFVSTSFTTKWLDYAPYGKPIFVWGPNYSSAYIFAKKYHCGITISTDSAKDLLDVCQKTARDPDTSKVFSENAYKVSQSVLFANNIHEVLKSNINSL